MGIRESRAAAVANGYYQGFLTDPTMDTAQRQYMYESSDPHGRVWTGSYRSFSAGQRERAALKERIAQQHNVTVEHLSHAEFMHSARWLCVDTH